MIISPEVQTSEYAGGWSQILFFLTGWDLKSPRSAYVMTSCDLKTDSSHMQDIFQKMLVTCVWQREDNRLTSLPQISIGTLRLTNIIVAGNCGGNLQYNRKLALVIHGLQARGIPMHPPISFAFDRTSTYQRHLRCVPCEEPSLRTYSRREFRSCAKGS